VTEPCEELVMKVSDTVKRAGARICVVLGALAYMAVLQWAYATAMSDWRYMGYTYYPPPLGYSVLAWILAIVPSLWMPVRLRRPSQIAYWLLYVVVFVPACFVPLYAVHVDPALIMTLSLCLFAALALLGGIYWLPLVRIPRIRVPRKAFWAGVILLSLLFYAMIFSAYGMNFRFVSLEAIYELRSTFKEIRAASGGLLGYAVGWQSNALNPLLIAQGLVSGNVVMLLVGILGQAAIYSVTGYKSALFSGGLLLALLLALRSKGKRMGLLFVWGSVGLVLVSALLQLWYNAGTLFSVFVRRLIITPGLLTGYYLEFFSQGEKVFLSHSVLRSFIEYPYNLAPAYKIGSLYFNDPSISANANLWADAYANFGFAGIFGFTFIVGLVMWLFDSLAKGRDIRLTGLLFGMPAFYLTNTALLTSLLTHGIGLVLVVIYFLPRTERHEKAVEQVPAHAGEDAYNVQRE